MSLKSLFIAIADALDGDLEIERLGRTSLVEAAPQAGNYTGKISPLPQAIIKVMERDDAHPACKIIAETALLWAPPQTSDDPDYIAHSLPKSHVELLGPDGLVKSNEVRLGLYGMLPGHEYGIRTHPAEEVFVMLAGEADWKRGEDDYSPHGPGARSYHKSMLPHANRTRDQAFMSVYVWAGDVSTEQYEYKGVVN